MAIELEELEVADENGEGRLRGPVRGFGTRSSRLHGTSDSWLEKKVAYYHYSYWHIPAQRDQSKNCTERGKNHGELKINKQVVMDEWMDPLAG